MDFKELDKEHKTVEIEQMKEPSFEINSYSYEEENSFTFDDEEAQFESEKPDGLKLMEVDKEPVLEASSWCCSRYGFARDRTITKSWDQDSPDSNS